MPSKQKTHTNSKITTRRGRLNGLQRKRLVNLLDMDYTPAELAQVLGIKRRQIYRVYRHLGMPCTIDSTGHILINGAQFREWYHTTYPKTQMGKNQTFCLTCFKPVEIDHPQVRQKNGLTFLQSTCPVCGRTLSRIVTNNRKSRNFSHRG